jgi:hypothetical protein
MKYRVTTISAILLALLACSCALPAQAESVSFPEYNRQLRDIAQKVDALKLDPSQAGKLVTEIPDQLAVKTTAGEVNVNFKSLKDDLAAFSQAGQEKRAALLGKIQNYVQALNAAADASEKPGTDLSSARGKLEQILSRGEFNKVKGPSAKDAFLAKIYRWLGRMLSKLAFRGGSRFDWMQLFIYLLVGAAVCLLLIWTIRRLRRPPEGLPRREIIPFSPSARGWRTWLAEARALAQQQDWRNAIHLAYWAGISYLEEHGAWKPNRARTPREYLRLVGTRAAQYPTLAALTRKLELVWYGYGTALESDFKETLGQLEKLGCR